MQELLDTGFATVIPLPFQDEGAGQKVIRRLRHLDVLFLLLSQEQSRVRVCSRKGERLYEVRRENQGLADGVAQISILRSNNSNSTLWRRWVRTRPAPSTNGKRLTLAICLPLDGKGHAVPYQRRPHLYVFFPTEESHGAHAMIHTSFDLQGSRQHLRGRQHDDTILDDFRDLFERVLSDIPPRTAPEAFGSVEPEEEDRPLSRLGQCIRKTLKSTPFVPVIGGGFVNPEEVQLWQDRLGNVLRDYALDVRNAHLLVPNLQEMNSVLEDLGARRVGDGSHILLLRHCPNDSLPACFASRRALITGGLNRVSPQWDADGRAHNLACLRDVPCWWTEVGTRRPLSDAPPLLFSRPKDWPEWLPADTLHARMRKAIERCEKKYRRGNRGTWKL